MRVCLLTSEARHSPAGEHIAALAERMDGATVVLTGTADWPGSTHVDELSGAYDAAIAFGWQACLHVFRVDAGLFGYAVPALEEAELWHGDERRLLAALTYDLPLTLIAPSRAVAAQLEDRAPGRRVVVVEPAIASTVQAAAPAGGALRVAAATDEVLARTSEPVEAAELGSAHVLLGLDAQLAQVRAAMLAGVVPVVTPADGHDELVADGENGLVVEFDDVPGTARALDTLARDRELLAKLREGALERASTFPSLDDEAKAILEAIRDPAPDGAWPSRLLLNARAVAEPIAEERRLLDVALRNYEERITALTAENERLKTELEEARRGLLERLRNRA